MKSWLAVISVVVGFQLGATSGRAGVSDVYKASFTLQGVVQSGTTNDPVISKVQVITADLINLGLGRALGTPINQNEILALASDCASNELRMIIYDLNSGGNLATIGSVHPVLEVRGFKKRKLTRDITGDLQILPTSGGVSGLAGGSLAINLTITGTTNDCLSKASGSMLGVFGVTFPYSYTSATCTNFISCSLTNVDFCVTNCVLDGGSEIIMTASNYNVAVTRATLQTKGKKLGTLIDNP